MPKGTRKEVCMLPRGFTLNMAHFVVPSNEVQLEQGKLKLGLTRKVVMPIFIDCSYGLGYIFGAFLSCGIANLSDYRRSTRGITMLRPKPDYPGDLEKLKFHVHSIFNVHPTYRPDGLYVYNVAITRMFKEFGIQKGRHLPDKYRVTHQEFNQGLIDGIEEYGGIYEDTRDISRKRVVSRYVTELYNALIN